MSFQRFVECLKCYYTSRIALSNCIFTLLYQQWPEKLIETPEKNSNSIHQKSRNFEMRSVIILPTAWLISKAAGKIFESSQKHQTKTEWAKRKKQLISESASKSKTELWFRELTISQSLYTCVQPRRCNLNLEAW